MKKTYIVPSVEINFTETVSLLADSIPTTDESADKDYDGGGDAKGDNELTWDIW